jgi:hypothetical protein
VQISCVDTYESKLKSSIFTSDFQGAAAGVVEDRHHKNLLWLRSPGEITRATDQSSKKKHSMPI